MRAGPLGYDLLVEKPMATNPDDAERMVAAARDNDVLLAVCHVLRYTEYSRAIKRIIASGRIGDVVTVEHLEPVGWWHHAHSYVRGQWAVEARSSSMLLAKSSHDIDWLGHIIDRPVTRVSSFGGLYHFKPENKPRAPARAAWAARWNGSARTRPSGSTSGSSATRCTSAGRWACSPRTPPATAS
ncbi:Gfo/Idh/MocA family protein [Actinokineospora soli]|uniref:Gfo/Idh/MocA family protein n=1 Tax=Actinokineospora soli TaxID=1048753 RepID=A0ABW2TNR5_9PSEU